MSTAQLSRPVPRAAGTGKRQAARTGANVARYAAVTLVALLFLLPFYIMVKTAVSPAADIASRTFVLWPSDPDWSSFSRVLDDPTFPRAMLNTAVMAVVLTGGQIVLAAMAGYAMARIPNRAAGPLFSATIVVLLIPAATTFLPNFLIVAKLGWVDSLRGLVVPGCSAPSTSSCSASSSSTSPRSWRRPGAWTAWATSGCSAASSSRTRSRSRPR